MEGGAGCGRIGRLPCRSTDAVACHTGVGALAGRGRKEAGEERKGDNGVRVADKRASSLVRGSR